MQNLRNSIYMLLAIGILSSSLMQSIPQGSMIESKAWVEFANTSKKSMLNRLDPRLFKTKQRLSESNLQEIFKEDVKIYQGRNIVRATDKLNDALKGKNLETLKNIQNDIKIIRTMINPLENKNIRLLNKINKYDGKKQLKIGKSNFSKVEKSRALIALHLLLQPDSTNPYILPLKRLITDEGSNVNVSSNKDENSEKLLSAMFDKRIQKELKFLMKQNEGLSKQNAYNQIMKRHDFDGNRPSVKGLYPEDNNKEFIKIVRQKIGKVDFISLLHGLIAFEKISSLNENIKNKIINLKQKALDIVEALYADIKDKKTNQSKPTSGIMKYNFESQEIKSKINTVIENLEAIRKDLTEVLSKKELNRTELPWWNQENPSTISKIGDWILRALKIK